MWSAGSEAVSVYVGETVAGVAIGDAPAVWLQADGAVDAWQRALQHLREAPVRRRKVELLLSGGLARPFIVQAAAGVKRWSEAVEVAQGLAPDATGLDGPCIAWLDVWHTGKPGVAVAMQRALRDELEAIAASQRVRLALIRPWWTTVLAADSLQPEPAHWLAIEDSDALIVLAGAGGDIDTASAHVPRPAAAQVRAMASRSLVALAGTAARAMKATLRIGGLPEADPLSASLAVPFGAHVEWRQ